MADLVAQKDIEIPQGSGARIRFVCRGFDNALYDPLAFRMQIRTAVGGTVLDSWETPDVDVELSTGGSGYVLLTISSADSEGYAAGDYVYDAEAQEPDSGDWFRIAEGKCCVTANVTV